MIWDVGGRLPGIRSVFETFPLDEVFPFVIWAFYNVLHNMSFREDSKTIAFCCPRVLVVTRITAALIITAALVVTAAIFVITVLLCQKLGAVGLTALGRAQLCPAVAGGALLRLSLPGPRCSLRAICPNGAHLVNVDTVGAAPRSTKACTTR